MNSQESNIREQFEAFLLRDAPKEAEKFLNALDFGVEVQLRAEGTLREGESLYDVTDRERVDAWREALRSGESWRCADPDHALARALTAYARFTEHLEIQREKQGFKPSSAPKAKKAAGAYVVEVGDDDDASEGDAHLVVLTRYERNPDLKKKCIEAYGGSARCEICGFDFERHYGPREAGKYIEVHHIAGHAQRSKQQGKHPVDCRAELIPLCANCHRMIHYLKKDTLSPAQLKKIWNEHHDR